MQVDWENDGTYDETHVVPAQPDGTVPGLFLHTYPAAWDGQARVLVTDADGGTGEVTTSVHVTPHRAQGPLDRVRVNDKPVRLVAISSSGRRVLYEDRNQYAPNHPTSAYGILDRDSGTHVWASVRPDGSLEDNPLSAVLSPDGRWVSWVGTTTANGTTEAMFVRDLMSGTTRTVASPQANLVAVRENRLYVVQQGLLRAIDLTTGDQHRAEPSRGRDEHHGGGGHRPVRRALAERTAPGVRGPRWPAVARGPRRRRGMPAPAVRLTIPSSGELVTAPQQVSVSDSGNDVVFTSENADLLPQDTNDAARRLPPRPLDGHDLTGVHDPGRTCRATAAACTARRAPTGSACCSGRRPRTSSPVTPTQARTCSSAISRRVRRGGSAPSRGTSCRVTTSPSSGSRSAATGATPGSTPRPRTWCRTATGAPGTSSSATSARCRPACHLVTPADLARTTTEDTAVDVDLPEGCPDSTWSITDGPQHGTVTGSGAKRSYAPAANWNGTDTFGYRITHGAESVTGVARITVSAVNDAPVATDVARHRDARTRPCWSPSRGPTSTATSLTYEITSQPGPRDPDRDRRHPHLHARGELERHRHLRLPGR